MWFPYPVVLLANPLVACAAESLGDNIIRALGRQLHPEQFHFVVFGKTLEFHHFVMPSFCLRPLQSIRSPIRLGCARIIRLAVVFERAILALALVSLQKLFHFANGYIFDDACFVLFLKSLNRSLANVVLNLHGRIRDPNRAGVVFC